MLWLLLMHQSQRCFGESQLLHFWRVRIPSRAELAISSSSVAKVDLERPPWRQIAEQSVVKRQSQLEPLSALRQERDPKSTVCCPNSLPVSRAHWFWEKSRHVMTGLIKETGFFRKKPSFQGQSFPSKELSYCNDHTLLLNLAASAPRALLKQGVELRSAASKSPSGTSVPPTSTSCGCWHPGWAIKHDQPQIPHYYYSLLHLSDGFYFFVLIKIWSLLLQLLCSAVWFSYLPMKNVC